jgi:predicted DNA-binding WGR domain protein
MLTGMSKSRYHLHLYRRDSRRNMARYYILCIETDLFGKLSVVRQWGRIGTRGRVSTTSCDSEIIALALLLCMARRKIGRGYASSRATLVE